MMYRIVSGLILFVAVLSGAAGAWRASQDEPPEALTIPPGYEYDPQGRRDPFVNPLTPEEREVVEPPSAPRPLGLPGVLLNEAELTAVVTSNDPALNIVVVQAPGNRIFIARQGDELMDAVIREIRSDIVVFQVKPLEGEPVAPPEIVVRPLSVRPGE